MLLELVRYETATTCFSYFLAISFLLFVFATLATSWRFVAWPLLGLKRLGIRGRSNLTDQYESKYANGDDNVDGEKPRIKALYIHPIKSCKPIELDSVLLTKPGFAYDRCFAFAAEDQYVGPDSKPVWRMITQRTKPQMSQIHMELWVPSKDLGQADAPAAEGGQLVVSFPCSEEPSLLIRLRTMLETWSWSGRPHTRFQVPLMPTQHQITGHNIKKKYFILQERNACGLDIGTIPEVASVLPQLKAFLRIPPKRGLTLLRCTPDTLHRTADNLAPLEHIGTQSMHGFTDDQPLHIINLASIHAVSRLLPIENQPLNALRFRANMYICGPPAYGEEEWKRLQIHSQDQTGVSAKLSVVCRASRCTMPNVNPETGIVARENPMGDKKKGKPQPSTTLVRHRMVETQNRAALGYMGIHCVPEDSSLKEAKDQSAGLYVKVGDTIDVFERGVHIFGSTANDY